MKTEISTPRMRLRPLAASDVDWLVALDSDPQVMRYINGGVPNSREFYLQELLPRMLAWADQPYGFFAAILLEPEQPIGWFHLRPSVADPNILELGYRLRRAVWGHGLATEGSLALLHLAFDTLGQTSVDACADPRNVASTAVMRKCGMSYAGRFMHPRANIQVVRYLVTRDAFAARKT
jgi:RimJ/RimL family protein N-acetyltransferase